MRKLYGLRPQLKNEIEHGKYIGSFDSRRVRASAVQMSNLEASKPGRRPVRLIFILLGFGLATAVGLGATWFTATRGTDLGTLTIGAWTARPRTGSADIDPYSRATIARSGELPIGAGDGIAFLATADDGKRPLDGRCDVIVSGVTPAARFWTLTLYDRKGHLVANSLQRYGFTSEEIVRNSDGSFAVQVASARAPATGCRPAASSAMC